MRKLFILPMLLIFGLGYWQCSSESAANQPDKIETAIPVKTMELEPRPFTEYLELTGTIEARNKVEIVAEEGGTLKKINRDKGSYAQKGDTLAVLENWVLEANYKDALAALHQAELDFHSKEVLFKKNAISENEYLVAKYALERAQAAQELSSARYRKLFITAPFNGFLNDRFFDLGAYIRPTSNLFEYIDNAGVVITAGVAERFRNDIKVGTPVTINFDAFPELEISDKVSYVYQSIDSASRTFKIEVETKNHERKLAPQMMANLKLLRKSYENQIVVPLDVLINSEEGKYVFVEKNNRAQKVPVKIVAVYQDSVLVDGLQQGERLVVLGQNELTDGDLLDVKNPQNLKLSFE